MITFLNHFLFGIGLKSYIAILVNESIVHSFSSQIFDRSDPFVAFRNVFCAENKLAPSLFVLILFLPGTSTYLNNKKIIFIH